MVSAVAFSVILAVVFSRWPDRLEVWSKLGLLWTRRKAALNT
jgi:hypothetical protein